MPFTRELLYTRHRLSHPQIDTWIGASEEGMDLKEKLQEMSRMAEFMAITDAFNAAGIKFISLKGPLLSQRLYGDTTYRRYRDFDFLFDTQNAEIAYQILAQMGYVAFDYKIPEKDSQKEKFFKHIQDITLYNLEKDTIVEIHWKLFHDRLMPEDQLQQIITSNLSEISLAGRDFTVLNPELDLLYLVIHAGLHRFNRLKWLVDIKDFIEKVPINVGKFEELTNQLNASRLVALCNAVLKLFFPNSKLLPGNYRVNRFLLNKVKEKIESKNKEEDIGSFKSFFKQFNFSMRAFPGWRYKLNIVHNLLYSSYVVHTKKESKIPFAYILQVPFQTILRWIKVQSNATQKDQNNL